MPYAGFTFLRMAQGGLANAAFASMRPVKLVLLSSLILSGSAYGLRQSGPDEELVVQGGKLTFVYIASLEEDGDDLETGSLITWQPLKGYVTC